MDYVFQNIIYYAKIIIIIICVFVILFSIYYLIYLVYGFKKEETLKKANKNTKFAVIIPARNESNVISGILNCLKNQTYSKDDFDVYVVIESKDDPSFNIVKKHGFNVVVRGDIENRKTKGFAIEDCLNYLKNNNKYNTFDSFIIFDADNLMNNNFIEKLNDLRIDKNVQVGSGYRDFRNASVNYISINSAMQLFLANGIVSKARSSFFKKVMINGTGYFIDREIIDKAGGWIFNGLTEDVQVSTYCLYHNVKMGYYDEAIYYDEEPTSHKIMHKQHIRWVWGFIASRKRFKKKDLDFGANKKFIKNLAIFDFNFFLIPIIIFIVLTLLTFLFLFITFIVSLFIASDFSLMLFLYSLIPLGILYFVGVISTFIVLILNRKKFKFSFKKNLLCGFTYILWVFDFVFSFFEGLFSKKKRSTWTIIPHKGK